MRHFVLFFVLLLGLSTGAFGSTSKQPVFLKLRGKLSANLQLRAWAEYTVSRHFPGCVDIRVGMGGTGVSGKNKVEVVISTAASNGEYSLDLQVNKHLGGFCGWNFSGVRLFAEKTGTSNKYMPRSEVPLLFIFKDDGRPSEGNPNGPQSYLCKKTEVDGFQDGKRVKQEMLRCEMDPRGYYGDNLVILTGTTRADKFANDWKVEANFMAE